MNRRTFFCTMLAAACTAVARAYVPAALATPRYVDKFVWNYDSVVDSVERGVLTVRFMPKQVLPKGIVADVDYYIV